MQFKHYPNRHKELWQNFCRLEPKPRPLEPPRSKGWMVWLLAVGALYLLISYRLWAYVLGYGG